MFAISIASAINCIQHTHHQHPHHIIKDQFATSVVLFAHTIHTQLRRFQLCVYLFFIIKLLQMNFHSPTSVAPTIKRQQNSGFLRCDRCSRRAPHLCSQTLWTMMAHSLARWALYRTPPHLTLYYYYFVYQVNVCYCYGCGRFYPTCTVCYGSPGAQKSDVPSYRNVSTSKPHHEGSRPTHKTPTHSSRLSDSAWKSTFLLNDKRYIRKQYIEQNRICIAWNTLQFHCTVEDTRSVCALTASTHIAVRLESTTASTEIKELLKCI